MSLPSWVSGSLREQTKPQVLFSGSRLLVDSFTGSAFLPAASLPAQSGGRPGREGSAPADFPSTRLPAGEGKAAASRVRQGAPGEKSTRSVAPSHRAARGRRRRARRPAASPRAAELSGPEGQHGGDRRPGAAPTPDWAGGRAARGRRTPACYLLVSRDE